jgi:hypothetical protein
VESMDVPNARADPASARDISRRCSFAPHFAGGHLLLWDISPGDSAGSQTRWLARKHTGSLANTLARSQTHWLVGQPTGEETVNAGLSSTAGRSCGSTPRGAGLVHASPAGTYSRDGTQRRPEARLSPARVKKGNQPCPILRSPQGRSHPWRAGHLRSLPRSPRRFRGQARPSSGSVPHEARPPWTLK